MSKVRHLLRKLHIGDHHHDDRPATLDSSPQTVPFQSSPPSTSSSSPAVLLETSLVLENENSVSDSTLNFLEEEFQVELALAMSVSDPGRNNGDPETSQINAIKKISLGCSPSGSLSEFLSLRYWSYSVINYGEKVIDGFYDVCGIDSNLMLQTQLTSLVDLESISVLDNVGYEVVLVNRAVDIELKQIEEMVYFMSMESRALDTSILVQKIANLIVNKMGGPVSDAEDMFRRWRARSYDLRIFLNTIVLPLGCLDVGHSRHRALLFKVLADRINLPCKLVKGSYYTGTDDGAVNLIKLDNGSEYIIDLMGAPGTLIPVEFPSGRHRSFGLDTRDTAPITGTTKSTCSTFDEGLGIVSSSPSIDRSIKTKSSSLESSSMGLESKRNGRNIAGEIQTDHLNQDVGDLHQSLGGACSSDAGKTLAAGQDSRVEDVSTYDISAATSSEFSRMPHYMLSENRAPSPRNLLSIVNPHNPGDRKLAEENGVVRGETKVDTQNHLERYLSKKDEAVVSFTGTQLFVGGGLVAGKKDASSTQVVEVACHDQTDASKVHNLQIDPGINGVAEILWEDLQIGERIGIGSYGEVYRAEWNGTEVAVKKLMNQDISGDALAQFKCEVDIMLRLRHPNVVLFMGAVILPPNLSILTEFLPRGSLYKLLHRPNIKIDEKRRIRMALDVARGMSYLHTSQPTIVHRDLKTPNLLVDKNWVVKVGDFGMSRLQHNTFLSSKSTAGTAEWMAPEVLRDEPSNEKSDVYSFGVILWELATLRVPWTELNSMQVVGAVGFQGRHLDIPLTVDPMVAEIISDCWNRNPQARPSFGQIVTRLKCLQRLTVQKLR